MYSYLFKIKFVYDKNMVKITLLSLYALRTSNTFSLKNIIFCLLSFMNIISSSKKYIKNNSEKHVKYCKII